MLKTVFKILAIYCFISIAVSGCALIGEYAEGISATQNGSAHTVPSTEGKVKSKSICEDGTLKQTKVVFDTRAESKAVKVLNTTEQEPKKPSQEVKTIYAKVDTLQVDAPRDLIKSAFEEMRKRRKFYISKRKCWRCRKYEFT